VDEATDTTDNTEGTDNSDDESTVSHDVLTIDASLNDPSSIDITGHPPNFSSSISMMYDGAEYPDHESDDHMEHNLISSTLMEIEEGDNDAVVVDDEDNSTETASFDSSEGHSDSAPSGFWYIRSSDGEILFTELPLTHINDVIDIPEDIEADNNLSFPNLPPPPRSSNTTPFELELSNNSTLVSPSQSDDD
tara:strand:+ start:305 stop:880 length:576 start_codon:yes stop_codon:yes gene_type:complete